MKTQINYEGILLEVEFDYQELEVETGFKGYLTIESINEDKIDVMHEFDEWEIKAIENMLWKEITNKLNYN